MQAAKLPFRICKKQAMKFFDNHTHTQFSPDSRMTVEQDVAAAYKNGMGGIAITDHLDLDPPRTDSHFVFDIAQQQSTIEDAVSRISVGNKKETGSPLILKGIEVGLQPDNIKHTIEYTAPFKFDTVIASIHFVDGEDPYFGGYYKNKSKKQAYDRVLELMFSTAMAYNDFDILGHFDYVARYAPYDDKDITYKEFADYLDPLLTFLADGGKALEINTKSYEAGVSHGVGTKPALKLDLNILRRFRELGGEAISLGSDSHDDFRLGEHFQKYWQMVRHCGFKYLCYFENRKPIFYIP